MNFSISANRGGLHLVWLMRVDELLEQRLLRFRAGDRQQANGIGAQVGIGLEVCRNGRRMLQGGRRSCARGKTADLDQAQRSATDGNLRALKQLQQDLL